MIKFKLKKLNIDYFDFKERQSFVFIIFDF